MSLIRLSVVVPVYNEERVIGSCVESLLALDFPPEAIEIIVVDNASTDSTTAIVEKFPVLLSCL